MTTPTPTISLETPVLWSDTGWSIGPRYRHSGGPGRPGQVGGLPDSKQVSEDL